MLSSQNLKDEFINKIYFYENKLQPCFYQIKHCLYKSGLHKDNKINIILDAENYDIYIDTPEELTKKANCLEDELKWNNYPGFIYRSKTILPYFIEDALHPKIFIKRSIFSFDKNVPQFNLNNFLFEKKAEESHTYDFIDKLQNPLAAMLAGSLLLAGSGWLAGYFIDNFIEVNFSQNDEKNTFYKKWLPIVGALLGAIPGWRWSQYSKELNPKYLENPSWQNRWLDSWPFNAGKTEKVSADLFNNLTKYGQDGFLSGSFFDSTPGPVISKNNFGEVVWSDQNTPIPLRAATLGVLEAASINKNSNWITPVDIADISLSMGSGWLTGYTVGKILGALAGLPPSIQKRIQEVGMWSGALQSTVPKLFGNN